MRPGASSAPGLGRQHASAHAVAMRLSKPRVSQDGRLRVYGCSPGCLVFSLVASLVLTVVVNLVIRLF
jgi:hypothetical protein